MPFSSLSQPFPASGPLHVPFPAEPLSASGTGVRPVNNTPSAPDLWTARRVHLVGIAGCGMRSLAEVLLARGARLSGSDRDPGPVHALASAGVVLSAGHAAEHLPEELDLLVYSDAVPEENSERRRARDRGIRSLSYFQVLGRLMASRRGIAVAGTHGKSTAAAMLGEILVQDGQDPTVVYGAMPLRGSSGGRAGRGDLMVAEACEFRRNFLHLHPRAAAILGIELDHFDCYPTASDLDRAFAQFAAQVASEGLLVVHDDPRSRRAAEAASCRVERFGLGASADWVAHDCIDRWGRFAFRLEYHGQLVAEVQLAVPGRHNVLNALAAAALAWHQGVEGPKIAQCLNGWSGLARRLEFLGDWRGVARVDDYAHHPSEVAAGLAALRRVYPGRRICCVFQPHQASRTARLLDELAASLHNADCVAVAEIYRAREPAWQPGEVTAADLAGRLRRRGAQVAGVHALEEIVCLLGAALRPGDVLVTMGAGDIRRVHDDLMDRFGKDRAAG